MATYWSIGVFGRLPGEGKYGAVWDWLNGCGMGTGGWLWMRKLLLQDVLRKVCV